MREHGLGFAVRNTLLDKVQLGSTATERLLFLQLNSTDGPVNLLCVYAPTLVAPNDTKVDLYSQLHTFIRRLPQQEDLVILGDFDARVGSDNPRGGGYSQKNWVGVCGPRPKTLTLFVTKTCEIRYPIYDLTLKSKPSSDQTVNINVERLLLIFFSIMMKSDFFLETCPYQG